jgi:glutathione peroxidase
MSIYATTISSLDGASNPVAAALGSVSLIVNVASKCGLTPQYEALESLQKNYSGKGFTVIGVPCNQFMGQEPGTPEEIATFCSSTYGVTFPLTEKVDVNGDNRHPLFAELSTVADGEGVDGDIRWNFEKFLVNRDGNVVTRFHPKTAPDAPEVIAAIESALG